MKKKIFHLILIKPSHYDDDGYVIQWLRSSIPSNSLAALYGLGLDCSKRNVLGDDVEIVLSVYDETNTRTRVKQISGQIKKSGGDGLVALVGVQSNQFPRAVDIARQFLAEDVPVCIGGFHVSGCLSMLPEIPADLQEAMDEGISLFAGEVEEGRMDSLLQEVYSGKMKPLYNYMDDLPNMEGEPVPFLPAEKIKKTAGLRASFDAGRGCPFLCSFCTIINVQGHKSRYRSADDVEEIMRANVAQGIENFFISDDDFARNRNWEAIFDRLIKLREEEGLSLRFVIQVDTMCHKIPRFIAKAARAGVTRVFIGMESINPDALRAAKKKQNRISEYNVMLDAWHEAGALTYAGYILGFPTDTPESILRDIKTIQKEIHIDIMEFFILTPLPGSEDHQTLHKNGVKMVTDMNEYDVVHVTTAHAIMTDKEWLDIYHQAWEAYYTPAHVEKVIRRSKKWGFNTREMMLKLLSFYACAKIEKVHPLEGGFIRLKFRKDRRPGRSLENPLIFYPRYLWETLGKVVQYYRLVSLYKKIVRKVDQEPATPPDKVSVLPEEEEALKVLPAWESTEPEKALDKKEDKVLT
ncbi:MAG: radical SAM protein [Nitrospira sp.]|nr:radical SAM protein [Candidatus Manganitrophaceae bacterium]HIL35604.1 radical SAM protein [Candidatus Manganitrophaceae bacterium]